MNTHRVHVQYLHTAVLSHSYIPLVGLKLKLSTHMGIAYHRENVHLILHESEHACVSAI